MCPDWESNLWPFILQDNTQPTEPHQSGLLFILKRRNLGLRGMKHLIQNYPPSQYQSWHFSLSWLNPKPCAVLTPTQYNNSNCQKQELDLGLTDSSDCSLSHVYQSFLYVQTAREPMVSEVCLGTWNQNNKSSWHLMSSYTVKTEHVLSAFQWVPPWTPAGTYDAIIPFHRWGNWGKTRDGRSCYVSLG